MKNFVRKLTDLFFSLLFHNKLIRKRIFFVAFFIILCYRSMYPCISITASKNMFFFVLHRQTLLKIELFDLFMGCMSNFHLSFVIIKNYVYIACLGKLLSHSPAQFPILLLFILFYFLMLFNSFKI